MLAVILIGVFLIEGKSIASQKSLIYKSYKEETGEILERSYVEIEGLSSGKKMFKRKIEGDDYTKNEQFVLGVDYQTQSWKATILDEDTDYAGEKKGNKLFIKGKLKGEALDKRIELDDKPFYYTPKFNLTKFVLSDIKALKFWMLRKDKLTKYLMQAEKRGEETIVVNGKEIDVIKVYYSATGMGEKFYKRIYFFRKSDGLFVKKEVPDGSGAMVELTGEE